MGVYGWAIYIYIWMLNKCMYVCGKERKVVERER
jgi:hypothetical protein